MAEIWLVSWVKFVEQLTMTLIQIKSFIFIQVHISEPAFQLFNVEGFSPKILNIFILYVFPFPFHSKQVTRLLVIPRCREFC